MTDPSLDPGTADETDDEIHLESKRTATTGTSPWQKLVGILGLVVVLWVGNRMYDVVFVEGSPGGPGPGGPGPAEGQPGENDQPAENHEQEIGTGGSGGTDDTVRAEDTVVTDDTDATDTTVHDPTGRDH